MEKIKKAVDVLMKVCGGCTPQEKILIVTDPSAFPIAKRVYDAAAEYPNRALVLMEETKMHGTNPTRLVYDAMLNADVIFGCTTFSLFHSIARKEASAKGARFVNMVDYSPRMLEEGGLFADFVQMGETCLRVASFIEDKETLHITSESGTDFTCSIKDIKPTPQIGRSHLPGMISSPPDVECATCAKEGTANGTIVVDGSIPIPGIGLITSPVTLTIKNSRIVEIKGGDQAKTLQKILENAHDENAYVIGEIGIALNYSCQLSGNMLEDEGTGGTIHFACGDNKSFGGNTACSLHLDMVCKKPTILADGTLLLDQGDLKV